MEIDLSADTAAKSPLEFQDNAQTWSVWLVKTCAHFPFKSQIRTVLSQELKNEKNNINIIKD